MDSSSQLPEGESDRCPVCGHRVPGSLVAAQRCHRCPHCGYLLWFQAPIHRPDDRLVEHTRRQIQLLVQEIAQLSKQDLAPEQYFGEFLARVVTALAAIGGAVWTKNNDGQLALQYQINLQQTNLWEENEENQARHSRLLYEALGSRQGMLVPPRSGFGDDERVGNPTDYLLVIEPLKTGLKTVGIVEVFQRIEARPVTQRAYLRFLNQMCELAGSSAAVRRSGLSPQVQEPQKIPWWKLWKRL